MAAAVTRPLSVSAAARLQVISADAMVLRVPGLDADEDFPRRSAATRSAWRRSPARPSSSCTLLGHAHRAAGGVLVRRPDPGVADGNGVPPETSSGATFPTTATGRAPVEAAVAGRASGDGRPETVRFEEPTASS
jgi:hypothetical protein